MIDPERRVVPNINWPGVIAVALMAFAAIGVMVVSWAIVDFVIRLFGW
jgi:hypothetical protein